MYYAKKYYKNYSAHADSLKKKYFFKLTQKRDRVVGFIYFIEVYWS